MRYPVKERIWTVEPYRPGKPIDEVKRELGLKQVIKLASNETPFGPSPKVLRAILKEAKNINRYPDGSCFLLRKEAAKRLRVRPDRLVFGNGSDEIIVLLINAFVGEGDEVVIAKPSFLVYDIASRLAGAAIRAVSLKNFRYDLDGMARAVTERTKLVIIGNPDNPAGTYVNREQLTAFLQRIPPQVIVLVDEAYYEYVRAKDYPDTIRMQDAFPNLVTTRTFSKLYGLAGLRIGYGIAPKDLVDILNRVREPFNVNSVAQAAALACLDDQGYYRRKAALVESQRKVLYAGLRRLGVHFMESVTNFILVDAGRPSSFVSAALLKRGVIVRDMDVWGLSQFIRVTIGSAKENQIFLKALQRVLKEQ
ncbi:MAG: histidinol-phosphate transaminase [Candidatus Omnitrophota bacterium]|nr:histidinol-phosphate transaminase [Candidatus Omnitrophota bacterium]MDZ4242812.1 histidinol-phosphate transaminase [Candidatus Omnitrophota bacterium]